MTNAASPLESRLIVEHFSVGPLQCNCVILGDRVTKRAIVVDPGGDYAKIMQRLAAHGLTVEAIVHTHTHFDHVGATTELHEATGAQVMLHREDLPLYENLQMQLDMFGVPFRAPTPPRVDRFLKDGEALSLGQSHAGVLHTPGHTPGSLSITVPGTRPVLIAGDTLFQRSIGRTDLWGGDYQAIARSIREKLYTLPEDTLVITGHGATTTIGEERKLNPFIKAQS